MDNKEFLITGLNNAYSMENAIEETLKAQISEAKNYPEIKNGLKMHLSATKKQAKLLKKRIKQLDGDLAEAKTDFARTIALVQGLAMKIMPKKILKLLAADFATENFEIAVYEELIIIAEELGDFETSRVCKLIMHDEMEMAKKIDFLLPKIIKSEMEKETGQEVY